MAKASAFHDRWVVRLTREKLRGASVTVPDEVADTLEAKGKLHLGTWFQPELEAAGIPDISYGDPSCVEASTTFSRLGAEEQRRQVVTALKELTARGLLQSPDPGKPVGGSNLELIRAVSTDFVFFVSLVLGDPWTDPSIRSGFAYGVRIPPNGWLALLDERIDFPTSRYDYTLGSTDDYSTLVAHQAFADRSQAARSDGAERESGMCDLKLMWAKGQTRREVHLFTARFHDDLTAILSEDRNFGLRRKSASKVTEDEFCQRLMDMFAEIRASGTAATRK